MFVDGGILLILVGTAIEVDADILPGADLVSVTFRMDDGTPMSRSIPIAENLIPQCPIFSMSNLSATDPHKLVITVTNAAPLSGRNFSLKSFFLTLPPSPPTTSSINSDNTNSKHGLEGESEAANVGVIVGGLFVVWIGVLGSIIGLFWWRAIVSRKRPIAVQCTGRGRSFDYDPQGDAITTTGMEHHRGFHAGDSPQCLQVYRS